MASKYAVALMALLGSAAAQGFNSSASASTTSSASVPVYTDGAKPTVGGVTYLIQTDTSYQGDTLRLSRKRQSDASIQSCLATCSADVECEGTAFIQDTMSCLYYSRVDTATKAESIGTDFALVQKRPSGTTTSDVFNGTTSAGQSSSTGVVVPSGSGNSTSSATRSAGVTGGAGNNSTTARPTGSASRTSSGVSSTTSGAAVPTTPSTLLTFNGVLFLIEIDISKSGISIDLALVLAKRAGQSLDDCLRTCAANSNCAATSFTESDGVCTFYSSVEAGSETVDDDSTFATVISRAGAVGSGANNGTSGGNNTTPVPSNATAESFICPAFNAAVLRSSVNVTFSISCSSFLIGTTFDIQPTLSKRQAFDNGLPQTLSNCVDLCSLSEECVGATFDIARGTCSYYSSIAYSTRLDGFDSAVRVQDNSNDGEVVTTTVAGQVTTLTVPGSTTTQYVGGVTSTATVYSTITSTVYANGNGATALPTGAVVTEVVSVSTITYVNTVSTITVPQNQNAAATVTVTVGGSGSGSGSNAPVVTQTVYKTVDQAGNVIGQSTANAAAGGVAGNGQGMYPTVTVFAACPTPAAQKDTTVWTTVYV